MSLIYPAIRQTLNSVLWTHAFPKVIVHMLFCFVGNMKLKKPTFITKRRTLELSSKEIMSFRIAPWISLTSRLPELRGAIFSGFLALAPWKEWIPVQKSRPTDIDWLETLSDVDKWSIWMAFKSNKTMWWKGGVWAEKCLGIFSDDLEMRYSYLSHF